jgi:hypothetical protein
MAQDETAQDGVEAGAVTSAGQDADLHEDDPSFKGWVEAVVQCVAPGI